ncbi:DNA-directed RNA polymerase subunit beta' [Bienertia sinuspersici]
MAPRIMSCFGKPLRSSSTKSSKNDVAATADAAMEEQRRGDGPILVELFSSQGCKISPEAELLISRLGRGDFNLDRPIIVLGFHVDYWDYMGWKDPFGSSQWTVRQKAYVESLQLDTMFTPQIVVQGGAQCVGNEEDNLLSSIASAPRFPSPNFQATFQKPTPETLQVSLSGQLRMKIDHQGANIMVALYENGLMTDCPKGENKGRVLSNDFVVRRLEKLCTIKDTSAKKNISGTVNFSLWESFSSNKCGVVVFVQQSTSHHIFGSQKFDINV